MARIPIQYEPRRVLIVKPSAIGDVVHALPILNLLKKRWPAAAFSWLVTPACAGILEGHPLLHEVIRFDRKTYGQGWRRPAVMRELLQFATGLRNRRFDVAIDLQGLFRSGWLTYQSGAPIRIGLSDAREMATLFYTHRVNTGRGERHAIERYLCVPEALGAGRGPVEFPFATTAEDARFAVEATPDRFALLFPGTNWATKRWPATKFAMLPALLRERYGLPTVVAGAPGEQHLAAQIPAEFNLTGRTTLNQLIEIIRRASLVVSNDSGPMHIAAALGRPLVSLFGPTNPIRTGPYRRPLSVLSLDIPCSPCYSKRCSHQSCLQQMEASDVMSQVENELFKSEVI